MSREQLASGWKRMICELPDGTTHFALHATTPGEIEAIAPDHAEWRTAEYALLASGAIAANWPPPAIAAQRIPRVARRRVANRPRV